MKLESFNRLPVQKIHVKNLIYKWESHLIWTEYHHQLSYSSNVVTNNYRLFTKQKFLLYEIFY